MIISNADLATVVGGQAPTPTPTPTPTPSPTVPDPDWDEQEFLNRRVPSYQCTGGFWHGCTERDRYR